MASPLSPAQLILRQDGTPYSSLFDDIYHSANGAFSQAQHVFIKGNELPARWAYRPVFTILETGFGLGVNFLATWAAWRNDAARCARLHFVSIEKHPFTQKDLRLFHERIAHTDLAPLAAQLCDAWPVLTPGLHRLEFESQRIILTLAFGGVNDLLPQLRLNADAFYLDGFAPAKNQEMWSPTLCKALARVATSGATLATYTAAGVVRRTLNEVGFDVHKTQGFNLKREMLVGQFTPRWRTRQHLSRAYSGNEKHALIIGAGLAGCALAERLTARNWQVSIIERHKEVACEASGNPIGLFHPLITRDDNLAARLSRAGFLYALRRWQSLVDMGQNLSWEAKGLIQLASQRKPAEDMQTMLSHFAYPYDFANFVTRAEASALAGITLANGGWYFPRGGWINPSSLCHAQLSLANPNLTRYFQHDVCQLVWRANQWCALDAAGHQIATAPVVIIASANDASRLFAKAGWQYVTTRSIRGQLTIFPSDAAASLRIPISGDGYLASISDTHLLTGASYELDDANPTLSDASHAQNFAYLSQLAPTLAATVKETTQLGTLNGRVAFRCMASDRLPLLGALADEALASAHADKLTGAHFADLPRAPGLFSAFGYGSRGLIWAALGAELIASQLEGEPWPIECALADAMDPARFLLKALRQGHITKDVRLL